MTYSFGISGNKQPKWPIWHTLLLMALENIPGYFWEHGILNEYESKAFLVTVVEVKIMNIGENILSRAIIYFIYRITNFIFFLEF
jgi:hypothetical protein